MSNHQNPGEWTGTDAGSWQIPSQDLPSRDWDVVIVGAGPAGSTLARCLASGGHEVLLLDRHRFPREKVCGDALIPDALYALRRAGLYDDVVNKGRLLTSLSAFSPSRIEVPISGEYITLKRIVFDALVARAAVTAGAILSTGTVDTVEPVTDRQVDVGVQGALGRQRARITVIATGADTGLLNRLGMVTKSSPSALAVRRYVKSRVNVDRLIVSYDRRILPGYGWIFPLGGDEYNVGCGMFLPRRGDRNLDTLLTRFLDEFPLGRELMAGATSVGELRGAPLKCGLKGAATSASGNVVAIGETIGATFPFTGEGIGKAMETAEIAAEVIGESLRGDSPEPLKSLSRLLDTQLGPKYLAYEAAQKWIAQSWMNDLIAWRAQRSNYMQKALRDMIADKADASRIFSIRGMMKSAVA